MSERHDLNALERYLDGDLTAEAAAACERHLAACPDCGRELARARSVRAALAAAEAPELAAPLYPAIAARLRERPTAWARWGFATAAAATLVAGLLAGARLGQTDGAVAAEPEMLAVQGSTLVAEGGEPTLDEIFLAVGGAAVGDTAAGEMEERR